MDFLFLILYPCITIALLYMLNRKFSYKSKLTKLLGSTIKYKITLAVIFLVVVFYFIFYTNTSAFRNPVFISIYFSYFYLVNIPKNLR